jgi:tungstate transport system permease protein
VPLLAAAMAGFGHAVAEVGSATIVGGNIYGHHLDRLRSSRRL